MGEFRHFVSLGHFCSVALDLEALGLREASLPFDWNIELHFDKVLDCIRNHFADFLSYELMSQSAEAPAHYKNEYDIQFFHDFNAKEPLEAQLPAVKEKYARRIARFYEMIAEPTLFIRYIDSAIRDASGRSCELVYIEQHAEEIRAFLKSFNPANEIIYIANAEERSESVKLLAVEKDPGDIVARVPREKNAELKELLALCSVPGQEANILKGKKAAQARRRRELAGKAENLAVKLGLRKTYVHDKRYR